MPALVAWIVAGFSSLFATKIGQWAVSVLVFLGLELGTQSFVVAPVLAQIKSVASGLSGDAIGWVAFFNLDKYITVILSAYAVGAGKRVILQRRGAQS